MHACPRCGKFLATKQTLDYHLNKRVRCDFSAQCTICLANFKSQEILAAHQSACYARRNNFQAIDFINRKTAESDMYVLNNVGVIVETPVHESAVRGVKYTDTIFPRFKCHADVFLTCSTERELVQKRCGAYKFVSTRVFENFTYVLENNAVICGKIVGTFTPPANLMDIQEAVICNPYQPTGRSNSYP